MSYSRSQDEIEEWTREDIEERMQESDRWLIGGLTTIYDKQTESEKRTKSTTNRNNVGFSSSDANFLTSIAEQVVENRDKYGKHYLTDNQISAARDAMMKYSQQLADIANGDR